MTLRKSFFSLLLILVGLPVFAAVNVKTIGGVTIANTKTVQGVAKASVKSIGGVDFTAGVGFLPSDISGLVVWHKPDALGLSDADPVSTLTDLSGNANSLTQAGSLRPLFKTAIQNGLGVLRFDGTDDYMQWGTLISPADCTVFIVMAPTGTTDTSSAVGLFSRDILSSPYGFVYLGSFGAAFTGEVLTFGAINVSSYGVCHTASFSGWHAWTFRLNGAAESIFLDDVSQTVGVSSSGHMDSSGVSRFININVLGAFGTGSNFAGDIGEVIIYNAALSDGEVTQVNNYLSGRWGTP